MSARHPGPPAEAAGHAPRPSGLGAVGNGGASGPEKAAAGFVLLMAALGAVMVELWDGTVLPLAGIIGAAGVVGLAATRWGRVC